MNAVTYSPLTHKFYQGALEAHADFEHAFNYEPVARLNPERKKGDGRIEFEAETARKYERAKAYHAVTDTSISSTITTVQLLTEVIAREWRKFHAIEATTRIPVPRLQLKVPVQTKFAASKKVPELEEAGLKASAWGTVSFDLWKNVAHIAVSDEAILRGNIDLMSFDIDQCAGSLAAAANSQIVTELETFTGASKGSWRTMNSNGDFSNRDPLKDITDEFVVLAGASSGDGIVPDTICMHPAVIGAYYSNTFNRGYAVATNQVLDGTTALPNYPGITVVVDAGFTATVATLFDRRGLMLGEGPTVAEQYRDPKSGFNGYVIRQWLQPLKLDNKFGRKLTSVA